MSDIVSLGLFFLFISIGYFFPFKSGWVMIFLATLLGPTTLTLVGSSFLPLTIYRIGFAITLGVTIKKLSQGLNTWIFKRNIFIKSLFLFVLIISILSIPDRGKNIMFSYIPNHYFAIMLPVILVNDLKDLKRLFKIYVWISAVIGFSAILEFFTPYDLSIIIEKSIPGLNQFDIGLRSKDSLSPMTRAGIYRPGGLWGNAVVSGYVLAFLFPITLWYAFSDSSKNYIKLLPLLLSFAGIALLQSRAVYIVILFSIFVLFLFFIRYLKIRQINRVLSRIILSIGISLIMILIVNPGLITFIKFYYNFLITNSMSGELSIIGKIDRIPMALSFFYESPLWGKLVSPQYTADKLMLGLDINLPLTYMISGGIILTSLYLFILFYMPYKTSVLLNTYLQTSLPLDYKLILLFSIISFLSGILVTFSNQIEAHFLMMFILFIAIINSFQFKDNQKMLP